MRHIIAVVFPYQKLADPFTYQVSSLLGCVMLLCIENMVVKLRVNRSIDFCVHSASFVMALHIASMVLAKMLLDSLITWHISFLNKSFIFSLSTKLSYSNAEGSPSKLFVCFHSVHGQFGHYCCAFRTNHDTKMIQY